MSVLTLTPETYTRIYRKALSYRNHLVCDIDYCQTFRALTIEQILQVVSAWCDLNHESFDKRYDETPEPGKVSDQISTRFGLPDIDTYQFLKWLHCIRYNIETDTIDRELTEDEAFALKVLDDAIEEICRVVIDQIPQYNEAAWCD